MAVTFERSHNTDRALAAEVRPRLRGLSHRIAAAAALPAAVWLVVSAPTTRAQVAVGVFGVAIAAMRRFSPKADENRRREASHVVGSVPSRLAPGAARSKTRSAGPIAVENPC